MSQEPRHHPVSFWSGVGLLGICGQKFEMVEGDDVYCLEMELMPGIEVGTNAMGVDDQNVYSKMEVSASTKVNQHKPRKEENEKGMSHGDALLASLQKWKKEKTLVQQSQLRSLLRQ